MNAANRKLKDAYGLPRWNRKPWTNFNNFVWIEGGSRADLRYHVFRNLYQSAGIRFSRLLRQYRGTNSEQGWKEKARVAKAATYYHKRAKHAFFQEG